MKRTGEEWRGFVDEVVDDANRGLRRGGLDHDAITDLLFRRLFGSNVDAGLEPEVRATEGSTGVARRAGASLNVMRAELVGHLRVGALNQHRRDGAWLDFDWSQNQLLVAVLSLAKGREHLTDGIAFAGRPNVGVRHLPGRASASNLRLPRCFRGIGGILTSTPPLPPPN